MIRCRSLLALAGAGLFAASGALAQPADYPSRNITMIVPFAAGGAIDISARFLVEELGRDLGRTIVVENKGGAGGLIGNTALAQAAPDGYTMGIVAVTSYSMAQYMQPAMPFDPETAFMPVSETWEAPLVLVVPTAHVPARSVDELIAWVGQQPQGVFYASGGIGLTGHLAGNLFVQKSGLNATHSPLKTGPLMQQSLLVGETSFVFDNAPTAMPRIADGQFTPLAVTAPERWPALPDVPTMKELGWEGFELESWSSIAVPAGTPREVVDKINAALARIAANPETARRFETLTGSRLTHSSPEETLARAAAERPVWKAVIEAAGLSVH